MSYMDSFNKIVTLTKRNHRYYGATESVKMKGLFTEIAADLNTIFNEISTISDNIEALASGYFTPSGSASSLYDLKRQVYAWEKKVDERIYIQADQAQVLI